jgi:hypothetical protein
MILSRPISEDTIVRIQIRVWGFGINVKVGVF